jgi:hypothetical protein
MAGAGGCGARLTRATTLLIPLHRPPPPHHHHTTTTLRPHAGPPVKEPQGEREGEEQGHEAVPRAVGPVHHLPQLAGALHRDAEGRGGAAVGVQARRCEGGEGRSPPARGLDWPRNCPAPSPRRRAAPRAAWRHGRERGWRGCVLTTPRALRHHPPPHPLCDDGHHVRDLVYLPLHRPAHTNAPRKRRIQPAASPINFHARCARPIAWSSRTHMASTAPVSGR